MVVPWCIAGRCAASRLKCSLSNKTASFLRQGTEPSPVGTYGLTHSRPDGHTNPTILPPRALIPSQKQNLACTRTVWTRVPRFQPTVTLETLTHHPESSCSHILQSSRGGTPSCLRREKVGFKESGIASPILAPSGLSAATCFYCKAMPWWVGQNLQSELSEHSQPSQLHNGINPINDNLWRDLSQTQTKGHTSNINQTNSSQDCPQNERHVCFNLNKGGKAHNHGSSADKEKKNSSCEKEEAIPPNQCQPQI